MCFDAQEVAAFHILSATFMKPVGHKRGCAHVCLGGEHEAPKEKFFLPVRTIEYSFDHFEV